MLAWLIARASFDDQERCLKSVIDKLSAAPDVAQSAATSLAYAMRARYWLESHQDPARAIDDATISLSLASKASIQTINMAYRALADAQEELGDIPGAIEAYQRWAEHDPSYRTKINKEIQRLVELSR